ncbi:MAG: hypothetical protein U0Q55_04900 [Vicinamibacterales bacterium]
MSTCRTRNRWLTFLARVFSLCALAWASFASPVVAQELKPAATGLFPAFDSSGEAQGELLAWHLTPAVYDELEDAGHEVVLLNPGGSYSTLDEAGNLEFARAAGVKTAIVPRLLMTERQGAKDSSPTLLVEFKVLNTANGRLLQSFVVRQDVSRKDLERGFDFGPGFHSKRFLWIPGTRVTGFHSKSRAIDKQALGRTLRSLASAATQNILTANHGDLLVPSESAVPTPLATSCEIEFRVRYTAQRAASRVYSVIVNDREESAGVDDAGISRVTVPAGLSLFQVTVKDAPYRLPVQKEYNINRWISCAPSEHSLTLEIGSAGDGLLVEGR